MQYLFKIGLAYLCIQVVAVGVALLLNQLDKLLLFVGLVMLALSLLLTFTTNKNPLRFVAAEVAAVHLFGFMTLDGVLRASSGTSMTGMEVLLAFFGFVLMMARVLVVSAFFSARMNPPEKFRDVFFSVLPLGIGIISSFLIMWNRAGKPPPEVTD